MPTDIKFAFENYLKSCIHHFKMTDHTESVQAEYYKDDLEEEEGLEGEEDYKEEVEGEEDYKVEVEEHLEVEVEEENIELKVEEGEICIKKKKKEKL